MRTIFTILILHSFIRTIGQNASIDKIESGIRKNSIDKTFDKQIIDLNNDGKDDIIYLYQCGEPTCIHVFFNTGGLYKEQINEQCSSYTLYTVDNKKILYLRLYQCCGESPYFSNRLFEFNQASAKLTENYVLTNDEYAAGKNLVPFSYSTHPFIVKVKMDNYNLRFSPSIEKLTGKARKTFTYACEEGSNIIAKIKIDSKINVLSEMIDKQRTWLFVEVEKSNIAGECNPIDFEFKDQKLRGWVSAKEVVAVEF